MSPADLATLRNIVVVIVVIGLVMLALRRMRPHTHTDGPIDRAACIRHGARLIDDGFEYFPDWSAAMLRDFDDQLQPHLKQLYKVAQWIASKPKSEWNEAISGYLAESGSTAEPPE